MKKSGFGEKKSQTSNTSNFLLRTIWNMFRHVFGAYSSRSVDSAVRYRVRIATRNSKLAIKDTSTLALQVWRKQQKTLLHSTSVSQYCEQIATLF